MQNSSTSTVRGTGWRRALVALSGLQALAVLGQAWLAGSFLTGGSGALEAHRSIALGVIQWIALASLLAAILWWRPGRGPTWPIAVTGLSLLAIGFQIAVGFSNLLQVHIPLGVSIFGLNLWLFVSLFGHERNQ